ncbi:MAG: fibronectin type III domain-containing protein [Candidatus Saganbacteria bacterium]|nr:fibronectin type III domain-containing protein [Candidatus Saganbacteria bacterium]
MKKRIGFLFLFLLFLAFAGIAFADLPSNLSPANSVMKPGGSYYYIPDQLNNRVRVISTSTYFPVTEFALSGVPRGMAMSPDGSKLYVAVNTASDIRIKRYNATANTSITGDFIVATNAGAVINGIVVSKDGNTLYAVEENSGKIYIIRVGDGAVSSITAPNTGLYGVAIKPDGSRLYVSSRTNHKVFVYNIESPSNPVYVTTISNCPSATYLICADASKLVGTKYESVTYLFVKVNQTVAPYNDSRVFDTKNDSMTLAYDLSVYNDFKLIPWATMDAHSNDPNNAFDGMTLGPNGAFIYLTHWDPSNSLATGQSKLFLYAYAVANPSAITSKWVASGVPATSKDSMLITQGGEDIWQAYSNGGDYRKLIKNNPSDPTHPQWDSGYPFYNTPPSAPTITSPVTGQTLNTDPVIAWNKATDPDTTNLTYIIEYITADAVSSNAWQPITFVTTTYATSSLNTTVYHTFQNSKSYYIRIKAYDGTDMGTPETPGVFQNGNFGPYAYTGPFTRSNVPDVPRKLVVTPGMTTAVATWWAVDEMQGSLLGGGDTYVVSYGTNAAADNGGTVEVLAKTYGTKWVDGFPFGHPVTGFWDNTDAKITGLNPGTTYKAKVKAVKDGVSSAYSSPVTPFTTTTTLTTPENLIISDVTMTTALATWWAVDGATNYLVEVYPWLTLPYGGGMWGTTPITKEVVIEKDEAGNPATWATIKGLTPGNKYNADVRAMRMQGLSSPQTSEASNGVVFNTSTKLGTPEGVVVSKIKMTSAQVTWEAVGGATGYLVEIEKPLHGGTYSPITQETVSGANAEGQEITWANVKGLLPGSTYTAKVTALREVSPYQQVSDPSPRVSFTTGTVLAFPKGIIVYNIGATSAWVSWEAEGGATGYTVLYLWSENNQLKTNLVTVEGGENITWTKIPTAEQTALKPNTTYALFVRADRTSPLADTFIPQHSTYASAINSPFTTGAFDGIIDDYEGTRIPWPAGYNNGLAFGTGVNLIGPLAGEGESGSKAMKVNYSHVGDYGGWGGYFDAMEIPAEYTYLQYSINSADSSQNEYHFELIVDDGTANGQSYAAPAQKLMNTGSQFKKQVIPLSSFKKVIDTNGNVDPAVSFENSNRIIKGYNVIYKGTTSSSDFHYLDNITVGSGAPGNTTHQIYDIPAGNENWVSVPFIGSSINSLQKIAMRISEQYTSTQALSADDIIAVKKFDTVLQMEGGSQVTLYYDSGSSSWETMDAGDFNVETGEMLKVETDIAGPGKFGNFIWQISGQAPSAGQVSFPLVYDSSKGNSSWMSLPVYRPDLDKASKLGAIIETAWGSAPELIEIQRFNNIDKTYTSSTLYKDAGIWKTMEEDMSLEIGRPYIVKITPTGNVAATKTLIF